MRMERACRFELDGKPLSSPTPGRCAGLWVVEAPATGRRSSPVHPSWLVGCESESFASYSEIVAALVGRITVAQDQVTIKIDRNGLAERLL